MTFDATAGGQITLAQGAALTANYRRAHPTWIKARYFGKDCINALLNQGGGTVCKGIRMYYAKNDTGEMELVLVGVDASGNDLVDLVMDLSTPCPKNCSTANALNQ